MTTGIVLRLSLYILSISIQDLYTQSAFLVGLDRHISVNWDSYIDEEA